MTDLSKIERGPDGALMAATIEVNVCECCNRFTVTMHDRDGNVFARAEFGLEAATGLSAHLIKCCTYINERTGRMMRQ